MVSHELRSPLTTMSASVRMVTSAMMGPVNADQHNILSLVKSTIDRLCRIITDLLDVSKIEEGKLELNRAQMDLAALIQEVVRSFEPLARERHLDIRCHAEPNPMPVMADRDKILQVFTNLVNNAIKFTEKGYVELEARIEGDVAVCRVIDTGPGIAAKDRPKVFGKFQQFGHAARGGDRGTGLGLSLCKGLVELHGGKIWVEGRAEAGTEFVFQLPLPPPQ
jgi:signal transduction histidine kinase